MLDLIILYTRDIRVIVEITKKGSSFQKKTQWRENLEAGEMKRLYKEYSHIEDDVIVQSFCFPL